MKSETDTGVILRVRSYLEYDALLVVFGKQTGKCSLLSKGLRRPRSRLSGILRPFSVIRFDKSVSSREEALATLIQAELLRPPSVEAEPLLLFIAEFSEKIIREGQKHDLFFDILATLPVFTHPHRTAAAFLLKSLTALGFLPRYEKCPVTQQKFDQKGYWQTNGELISDGNQTGGVPFEFDEIKVLRFWQMADLSLCEKVDVSEKTLQKIFSVLLDHLEHEHGIVLKTKSLLNC